MTICFGENLRRLRKARALTQSNLAAALGVSFQTVSKWECGETYPDITMLPVAAAFFGVTVDELLCAGRPQHEEKIRRYLALYDDMHLTDAAAVLTEYQTAVKEFPNEFPLLIRYMELLRMEATRVKADGYALLSKDLEAAYRKIQHQCTDDGIRIRAKRLMFDHRMWQYQCLGFDETYKSQAEEILAALPALRDAREYTAISLHCDVEEWYTHSREAMEELTYLLQNVIIGYYYYDDRFSPQEKIDVIRLMNGIIRLLDNEDHPTKNRMHRIYNNGHLGHLYAAIGDTDNALKYFRLAAAQAVAFDALPDAAARTALFYEQEERYRHMPMRERMKALITKHYPLPEDFRDSAAFQQIVAML